MALTQRPPGTWDGRDQALSEASPAASTALGTGISFLPLGAEWRSLAFQASPFLGREGPQTKSAVSQR